MLRKEYDITYDRNGEKKMLSLIVDGNDCEIIYEGETLKFKEKELSELVEFLHAQGFSAELQEDILSILKETEEHRIREDINYLLVELETMLDQTDKNISHQFFKIRNRLHQVEGETAKDIKEFESLEDEFDLN